MIEQLELKLTEALTERTELEDVVIPEARFFVSGREASSGDTMKHSGWTRSSGFAIAAAAALVITGLAVLSLRSARSDVISTIDNDPAIATNPVTLTTLPASTSSAEADSRQELSEANQSTIETQEISLDYLAALPGPNPTLSPPSLDWVQIETPEGSEGFRTVSYVGDDYFLNAYDALWMLDRDQESEPVPSWVQLDVPADHVVKQILTEDPGHYQVITIGPIHDNPETLIWQVSSDLRLVDPVPVTTTNPHDLLPLYPPRLSTGDDFIVWKGSNFPLIESIDGHLVVATSFSSDLDIEALLVDRGVVRPGERICELEYGEAEFSVSLSATATTDRECMASSDIRTETHTAETLGIPEDHLQLFLGPGRIETRTVVSLVDEAGQLIRLVETPGELADMIQTGGELTLSVRDELSQSRVLRSSGDLLGGPWLEYVVPGQVFLSSAPDGSFYVLLEDDVASLFRLGDKASERNLGPLPNSWQLFSFDQFRGGPGGIALSSVARSGAAQEGSTVFISNGFGLVTSVSLGQEFGLYWSRQAVGASSVMIAATDQAEGSLSIYLADFPAS